MNVCEKGPTLFTVAHLAQFNLPYREINCVGLQIPAARCLGATESQVPTLGKPHSSKGANIRLLSGQLQGVSLEARYRCSSLRKVRRFLPVCFFLAKMRIFSLLIEILCNAVSTCFTKESIPTPVSCLHSLD